MIHHNEEEDEIKREPWFSLAVACIRNIITHTWTGSVDETGSGGEASVAGDSFSSGVLLFSAGAGVGGAETLLVGGGSSVVVGGGGFLKSRNSSSLVIFLSCLMTAAFNFLTSRSSPSLNFFISSIISAFDGPWQ